jgi:hypothetical protein
VQIRPAIRPRPPHQPRCAFGVQQQFPCRSGHKIDDADMNVRVDFSGIGTGFTNSRHQGKLYDDMGNCQSAFKFGSDSLLMIFAGDLGFSNGELTPCELAFKFRHLCLVGWRLTV